MMSQLRFACAVQLPLQLAVHWAWHDAIGGVPLHCPLQCPPQLALQEAWHCAWSEAAEQDPLQCPSQSASQEPWQLNMPGFAMQLAMQLPVQVALQFTSADAVHVPLHDASSCAEHAASKLMGVHLAVQPPDVSSVHEAFACTSMLPHEERMSARAVYGVARSSAPTERGRTKDGIKKERCIHRGSHDRAPGARSLRLPRGRTPPPTTGQATAARTSLVWVTHG
jgi:hypothetical protein